MNELKLVFQQTLWGEVVREARYDQITHFTSGDKYTTAHYGEGQELVFRTSLQKLAATFADLIHTHRSVLVRVEQLHRLRRHPGERARYYAILKNQQCVPVSDRHYPAIRDLLKARRLANGGAGHANET